ncbi:hypothetical protein LX32DRAFT_689741 [Colletotrichum zoysiae]|uniref:Uncharacterized protein n=1 Tax=Colletotrichum zoysiae TaxID=1216348 RepID=A0AAD9HRR4_9PEZI|nr:hypothetical protein LX32DRAFT_689741 [Colletotrichum zoysiae]
MFHPNDEERKQIATSIFGKEFAHRWNGPESKAYFDHYCSLVCPEDPGDAIIHIGTQTLKCHTDVVSCVKTLRKNPSLTVDGFITEFMGTGSLNDKEKKNISKLIVSIAFMIDCSPGDYFAVGLERNDFIRDKWDGDVRFAAYVQEAFTQQRRATKDDEEKVIETMIQKKSLKAWKLAKRYDITIRPTNNLLDHLAYDTSTKTLSVFHQLFFLRAHLAITKDQSLELGFEESLSLGTLPPRLLLETLLTVHTVLFPIIYTEDDKSYSLLQKMIRKHSFDQEAKLIDFVRTLPPDMVFEYWGSRLAKLHDAIKRPPPTNPVVSWLERHTSERNALMVAIVGLFLAALFGFLSFVVGLLQLILAWVVWKHPN